MTFGSLFAGIGGFDLGLEKAGMDCKWQCEIDKNAIKILEKYWPEVKKYNDVRQLTNPEPVDLICGGFPCQDLSTAGNRLGLAGQRSGLFFEMARIIDEIRPKWFILENVPGLLSSKNGQDMQTVLETLVKLGYCIAYRVLDSKNFGVAQRRKRVFIIGSLGNPGCAKVLFGKEGNTKISKNDKKSIKNCISTNISSKLVKIARIDDISSTMLTNVGTIGNPTSFPIVHNGIRKFTEKECERLQGFPDGWTEGISSRARYKALGNAVTVDVIEWIGKRIANEMEAICSQDQQ